jgi:hypothetical protein
MTMTDTQESMPTRAFNIYRDVGCSQEDHLANCSHFGYTGEYLSEHAPYCNGGRTQPCTCNPEQRAKRREELEDVY